MSKASDYVKSMKACPKFEDFAYVNSNGGLTLTTTFMDPKVAIQFAEWIKETFG